LPQSFRKPVLLSFFARKCTGKKPKRAGDGNSQTGKQKKRAGDGTSQTGKQKKRAGDGNRHTGGFFHCLFGFGQILHEKTGGALFFNISLLIKKIF
jgi:hypothetical protein